MKDLLFLLSYKECLSFLFRTDTEEEIGKSSGNWWLRSHGVSEHGPMFMDKYGYFGCFGARPNNPDIGVRPALRVPAGILQVGSKVRFGSAEWIVISAENKEAVLLAKDILCNHQFDMVSHDYETSEIRRWMNQELVSELFSEEEKSMIIPTDLGYLYDGCAEAILVDAPRSDVAEKGAPGRELSFTGTLYLKMRSEEDQETATERLFNFLLDNEIDILASPGCYETKVYEEEGTDEEQNSRLRKMLYRTCNSFTQPYSSFMVIGVSEEELFESILKMEKDEILRAEDIVNMANHNGYFCFDLLCKHNTFAISISNYFPGKPVFSSHSWDYHAFSSCMNGDKYENISVRIERCETNESDGSLVDVNLEVKDLSSGITFKFGGGMCTMEDFMDFVVLAQKYPWVES